MRQECGSKFDSMIFDTMLDDCGMVEEDEDALAKLLDNILLHCLLKFGVTPPIEPAVVCITTTTSTTTTTTPTTTTCQEGSVCDGLLEGEFYAVCHSFKSKADINCKG